MCEEYSAGEGKKRKTLSLISTTKGDVLNVFLLTKLTTANLFLLYSSVKLYCCVASLPPPFFLSCKASLDRLNRNTAPPPSFYLRLLTTILLSMNLKTESFESGFTLSWSFCDWVIFHSLISPRLVSACCSTCQSAFFKAVEFASVSLPPGLLHHLQLYAML